MTTCGYSDKVIKRYDNHQVCYSLRQNSERYEGNRDRNEIGREKRRMGLARNIVGTHEAGHSKKKMMQ